MSLSVAAFFVSLGSNAYARDKASNKSVASKQVAKSQSNKKTKATKTSKVAKSTKSAKNNKTAKLAKSGKSAKSSKATKLAKSGKSIKGNKLAHQSKIKKSTKTTKHHSKSINITSLSQNPPADKMPVSRIRYKTRESGNTQWSSNISDPIGNLLVDVKKERNQADVNKWTSILNHSIKNAPSGKNAPSRLAQATLNYLGVRYRMGGTSPISGFDCSGLVQYVFNKHLGINLPRTASSQAHVGAKVSFANLQPGDLLFFNTRGAPNSHVGVYLGNNEFVHSPRTGSVVRVEKISSYWNKRFNGARRIDGSYSTRSKRKTHL